MLVNFDTNWIYHLNGWMVNPVAAQLFTFIALWGILYFVAVVVWLWYSPSNARTSMKHKRTVVMIALAVLVALLIVNFFDVVTPRPRPYVALDHIIAVNVLVDAASFPSLHVAMTFSCAAMLLMLGYRALGVTSLVVALLIGLSRVVVGVHYPTDILGGMIVGVVSAAVIYYDAAWIRHYLPAYKQ